MLQEGWHLISPNNITLITTNLEILNLQSGVEKKNDDLRRIFHRKINRWDAPANLLLVEKRQEVLKDVERAKRCYTKRNIEFWEKGKSEVAKKVPRVSTAEIHHHQDAALVSEESLKKKKVSELISILEKKTGKTVYKKTRKQEIIDAILANTRLE